MATKRFCDKCAIEIHLPVKVKAIEVSLMFGVMTQPWFVSRQRVEMCVRCANELAEIHKKFMGPNFVPRLAPVQPGELTND